MRVDPDLAARTYQRLVAGEPDAPADLVELFLDPLIAALRAKYPALPDPSLIDTIVIDSLFRLVQTPDRYQPSKSSLWNYLYMDVNGDLTNAYRSEQKRTERLIPFDPVAHDHAARNDDIEALLDRLAPERLPTGMSMEQLVVRLRQQLTDPRDWTIIDLMLRNERHTEAYARVMGISERPIDEQRRLVKRAKDRLRMWLKRQGVQTDG